MKALFLILLLLPLTVFAGLSPVDNSLHATTVEFTFTQEYTWGQTVDLIDVPAGARVYTMFISPLDSGAFVNGQAYVGTATEENAWITDYIMGALGNWDPGLGVDAKPVYKESNPSTVRLKWIDPANGSTNTTNLTGRKLRLVMTYVQE